MPPKSVLSSWTSLLCLTSLLWAGGCKGSPYAGDWVGIKAPAKGVKKAKQFGYSETKASMDASLHLEGNGTYTAKLQDVDYTGNWTAAGSTVTLTPETYMGLKKENIPPPKTDLKAGTMDTIFRPYTLDLQGNGSTMTHSDDSGITTYKKKG